MCHKIETGVTKLIECAMLMESTQCLFHVHSMSQLCDTCLDLVTRFPIKFYVVIY